MRRRLAFLLLALALAPAAGCMSDGAGDTPAPSTGRWHLERTVDAQPANCHALGIGALELDVSADDIVVTGAHRFDNGDLFVDATTLRFATDEFALVDSLNPIIIGHDLTVDGDTITGTGSASGDGDDLGCHYAITITGARR